ncbi:MAG: hypothetical protein AB1465_03165 [Patescibacteria group bacterium]
MSSNQIVIKTFSTTPDFYTKGPVITTTGATNPVYMDPRKTFTFPDRLKIIVKELAEFIKKEKINYDIILGGATCGIMISTALGLLTGKPAGYVRKKTKEAGLKLAVEGYFKPEMKAIIVDDAIGHGDSKIQFIKNIQGVGMNAEWVLTTCSRYAMDHEDYKKISKEYKVKIYSLCALEEIARYSLEHNIISKEAYQLLVWYGIDGLNWSKNPKKWQYFQNYLKK